MELNINEYKKGKDVVDIKKVVNDINFKEGEHLAKLFSKTAYAATETLKYELGSTQFRKFYDKVLEINEKAKRVDDDKFNVKIKPLLSLMYSKVEYAVTRGNAGFNFKKIMFKCLDKVNSKDELERFKYFLEAIIGFMPKSKLRGKK